MAGRPPDPFGSQTEEQQMKPLGVKYKDIKDRDRVQRPSSSSSSLDYQDWLKEKFKNYVVPVTKSEGGLQSRPLSCHVPDINKSLKLKDGKRLQSSPEEPRPTIEQMDQSTSNQPPKSQDIDKKSDFEELNKDNEVVEQSYIDESDCEELDNERVDREKSLIEQSESKIQADAETSDQMVIDRKPVPISPHTLPKPINNNLGLGARPKSDLPELLNTNSGTQPLASNSNHRNQTPLCKLITDIEQCVQNFNENKETCDVVIVNDEMLTRKAMKPPKKSYPSIDKSTRSGSSGVVHNFDENLKVKTIRRDPTKSVTAKEMTLPLKLSHPAVVAIASVKNDRDNLYIYMENAGSPLNELVKDKKFRQHIRNNAIYYAWLLYDTIRLLEEHGIAHRDIKLQNWCAKLVKGKYKFCLIDFGSVQEITEENPVLSAHTVEYLCPFLAMLIKERRLKKQMINPGLAFFEQKGDCFSTTLVLYHLLTGHHLIEDVNRYKSRLREEEINCYQRGYSKDKINEHLREISQQLRVEVIEKIINMKENSFEQALKEINAIDPDLGEVFGHTLCLDKDKRWSGTECSNFLEPLARKKNFVEIDDHLPCEKGMEDNGNGVVQNTKDGLNIKFKPLFPIPPCKRAGTKADNSTSSYEVSDDISNVESNPLFPIPPSKRGEGKKTNSPTSSYEVSDDSCTGLQRDDGKGLNRRGVDEEKGLRLETLNIRLTGVGVDLFNSPIHPGYSGQEGHR